MWNVPVFPLSTVALLSSLVTLQPQQTALIGLRVFSAAVKELRRVVTTGGSSTVPTPGTGGPVKNQWVTRDWQSRTYETASAR